MDNSLHTLQQYFHSFGIFTDDEIREALLLFRPQTLSKSELFIREGEKCTEVAFIVSGTCRSYYLSGNGDEMTYCFRFPGEFLTAYSSFITGQGSLEYIQALDKTELLVIGLSDVNRMAERSTGWLKFLKITAEQQYIELEKRIFQLQRVNASLRYNELMRLHPDYIRTIPLHYLASYLGITQRHLSRIRK